MERSTQESNTNVTGTGSDVRATSPTIVTPILTSPTITSPTITSPVFTPGGVGITERKFCTTEFVAVTGTTGATLTNVVGLTGFTLTAAGIYNVDGFLIVVGTANSGVKLGFKYTTATLTSLNLGVQGLLASSMTFASFTTASDAASIYGATSATLGIRLQGRIIVNAGGTLAVQAAQNAAHADETKVLVGSYLNLTRVS